MVTFFPGLIFSEIVEHPNVTNGVLACESFVATCIATNISSNELVFLYEGTVIQNSTLPFTTVFFTEVIFEGSAAIMGTLQISSVTMSTAGTYICEAAETFANFSLVVETLPGDIILSVASLI